METPSVSEAALLIRAGELSAEDLTRQCLDVVDTENTSLNAFIFIDEEHAITSAREVDRTVLDGRADELGPLAGVPFGVKDLEDCAGMPTTRGSRWFADGPVKSVDSIHVGRCGLADGNRASVAQTTDMYRIHRLHWSVGEPP